MLDYIKNRIKARKWFKDVVESKLTPDCNRDEVENKALECEFYFYLKEGLLYYKAHDDTIPCVIDESTCRCKICGL